MPLHSDSRWRDYQNPLLKTKLTLNSDDRKINDAYYDSNFITFLTYSGIHHLERDVHDS